MGWWKELAKELKDLAISKAQTNETGIVQDDDGSLYIHFNGTIYGPYWGDEAYRKLAKLIREEE